HRETGVQQVLGKHGESFRDRWIDRLTQIGGDYRAGNTSLANIGKRGFPCSLGGIGGREAVLDHRAQISQFFLFVPCEVLRREFGVRDDNLPDIHLPGGADQGEDLAASQVAGGQDQVLPGDSLQAPSSRLRHLTGRIKDGQRRRRDTVSRKLTLDCCPER